jgi:signal transduction histidine kinase
MLSEVVRENLEQSAEAHPHMERIIRSANEMVQGLDEIVWAINPSNDSLEKLILFIGEFASRILEPHGILCRLDMPDRDTQLELKSKIRHQLCMAVKESLANVIKHAQAHKVRIQLGVKDGVLKLWIEDDGLGFDPGALRNVAGTHNGISNIMHRMADIGGKCDIKSVPGQGTRVVLEVKV